MQSSSFQSKILSINSQKEFEKTAIEIFQYQAIHNAVYANFLKAINIAPQNIYSLEKIPFLPIEFFKTHQVTTHTFKPETIFSSSGTTGAKTSKHLVRNIAHYERCFLKCFELFYGSPNQYSLLALLPSYLEREGSSLVLMTEKLIALTGDKSSGFFLKDYKGLANQLEINIDSQKKTILLGVTYALLDFADKHPMPLENTIVMETGGMKGMRKEMIREEISAQLKKAFGISEVHSEYGMTELMSQAYAQQNGIFNCPAWMRVMVREANDPFSVKLEGKGILNIVDLANVDSCAFISTQDVGEVNANGSFTVLGRMDEADIRGCNLLVF